MSGNRCSNHKKHVNNCIKYYCTIIFVHTVNIFTKHLFYLMVEIKGLCFLILIKFAGLLADQLFNLALNVWMKLTLRGKNIHQIL